MNELRFFKNVLSTSAGLVSEVIELLIIPKHFIDENVPNAEDESYLEALKGPEKLIMVCKIVKYGMNATYYYDEYFEGTTKVKNKTAKWLIFGMVAIHVIGIGIMFYQLLKQDTNSKKQLKKLFSGYISPVLSIGIAIFCIALAYKADGKNWRHKTQAILDLVSSILGLWRFEPVKQVLLKNPKGMLIVGGIGITKLTLSGVKLHIMPKDTFEL
jgi:hypothetical protein